MLMFVSVTCNPSLEGGMKCGGASPMLLVFQLTGSNHQLLLPLPSQLMEAHVTDVKLLAITAAITSIGRRMPEVMDVRIGVSPIGSEFKSVRSQLARQRAHGPTLIIVH